MILIAFSIFFKIANKRLIWSNNAKIEKADDSCGIFQDSQITNFQFCQSGEIFSFVKCIFDSTTTSSQTESANIIHSCNVNLNVESCQFNDCTFTGSVIYCENQSLIMYSNSIYNCLNHNSPNSRNQKVIAANASTNIQSNNITFLDTNHLCRAYQIDTFSNTIFKNNRIIKAHQSKGSALFFNNTGIGDPLEISGCFISNCVGDNGAILYFNKIIPFFQIFNTTFEYFTNSHLDNNLKGNGYYFNIIGNSSDFNLLFEGCIFNNLESNAIGGGAIGLWAKNNGLIYDIIFKKCRFENLYFSFDQFGGALIFYSATNRDANLDVIECVFINVSSKLGGAAITYGADSGRLLVEKCNFIGSHTIGDNGNGGSIYISALAKTQPVIIRDCLFENSTVNCSNGNAIHFEAPGNQECTIQNCQFIDCGTTGYAIKSSSNRLIVDEITIKFTGTKSNGIIFEKKGQFQIINSLFYDLNDSITYQIDTTNNNELTIDAFNCTFQSVRYCFVFKVNNYIISNSNFYDCSFSNNYLLYFDNSKSNTLKFENCNFTKCNSKYSNTNSIILLPTYQSIEIDNCIFNLCCTTSKSTSYCMITYSTIPNLIITYNLFIDCCTNQLAKRLLYLKYTKLRYEFNIINFTDTSKIKRPSLVLLEPGQTSILNSQFINTKEFCAIQVDTNNKLTTNTNLEIIDCIFDNNNNGGSNQCFDFRLFPNTIIFQNNIIKNQVTNGQLGLLSFISTKKEQQFDNITFISISRNANAPIFSVENVDLLKFNDCKWINNNAPNSYGGGAVDFGSQDNPYDKELYFFNCHFNGNSAYSYGGTIGCHTSKAFSMIDCTISNSLNTDGNGFMIYLRSFVETEPVLIDNCYFHDNIGTTDHGIFYHSAFTNIIFQYCVFENNYNKNANNDTSSQVIYLHEVKDIIYDNCRMNYSSNTVHTESCCSIKFAMKANANIINSIFYKTYSQGAIKYEFSDLSVQYNFELTIQNCTFDHLAGENSPCFFIQAPHDVIFHNNTISNRNGNYVACIKRPSGFDLNYINITSCRFINLSSSNPKGGGCGLLFLTESNLCHIRFIDCLFENNEAKNDGGVLDFGTSDDTLRFNQLEFTACIFINNKAKNGNGGAISISTKYNTSIHNCSFYRNYASQSGGAIHINPMLFDMTGLCTILNCYFDSNFADNNGQAIFLETRSSDTNYLIGGRTIFINNFKDNTDETKGIIELHDTKIDLVDVTFKFDDPTKILRPIVFINLEEISDSIFENVNTESNYLFLFDSIYNAMNINNCIFTNCYSKKSHFILSSVNSLSVKNSIFQFTPQSNFENKVLGAIKIIGGNIISLLNTNFINIPSDSGINVDTTGSLSFDNCTFDNSAFYISFHSTFSFINNVMKNINGTVSKYLYGIINCNDNIEELHILNMKFINNTCNNLYGGGTGLQFKGIKKLSFEFCQFIQNRAEQDKSQTRHNQDPNIPYYNGDGGAIQLGYLSPMNDIDVSFDNCIFKQNNAFRHGGAIAIQTLGVVDIINCIFEGNSANECNSESSSELLYDNYFHLKKDGRGGAIYINPSYYLDSSQPTTRDHMTNLNINNCSFRSNKAYDGHAIYIEGDNHGTQFSITGNKFIDNYPPMKLDRRSFIIATEICDIAINEIIQVNYFSDGLFLNIKNISCVDHEGNILPTDQFSKSSYFSKSIQFSESEKFSNSLKFSESNKFSNSKKFSYSLKFTNSALFTESSKFSGSIKFSESKKFSQSYKFSESDKFSFSLGFTKSNQFSNSLRFSRSNSFSKSFDFSQSTQFSKSAQFSESNKFTKSVKFSESDKFSGTDDFSKSTQFSESNKFSGTSQFTESNKFSKTAKFSESNKFSETEDFSQSAQFTKSTQFSESNKFSETSQFTESNKFSETAKFSESNKFSETSQFTESNKFSKTAKFSESNKFSETGDFSQSSKFSETEDFSQSSKFSETEDFSQSSKFSETEDFSQSSKFSETVKFSESNKFSETEDFSQSAQFTKSTKFTKSEKFSETAQFSESNKFSETEDFSQSAQFTKSTQFSESNKFSETTQFTESNKFSKTSKFSESNKFSETEDFSQSSQFSETAKFSESDKFSETSQFTESNKFSETEDFSQSIQFTKSAQFSQSNKFSETAKFSESDRFSGTENFSQSNKFSETAQFSESDKFTKSAQFSESEKFGGTEDFSQSNIFSESFDFTQSNQFSKSAQFSESEKFSVTEDFSKSNQFSFSEKFTKSNLFSKSNDFSKSNEFSNSGKFSKTNLFSESFYFSQSNKFSYSKYFSQSDKFSESNHFSNSDLFSKTESFTKSYSFSESFDFSQSNKFSDSFEFTQSDKFSESNDFSNSNLFSKTEGFTKSYSFSESFDFSQSNKFSYSKYFSQSDKFSESNHFSNSDLFSKTESFTKSYSFSESFDFSQSNKFSDSFDFTQSDKFSGSSEFSKSNDFSNSEKFSKSNSFSESSDFSQSDKFSYSNYFSQSSKFSESKYFSQSSKFSYSNYFSQSSKFSESKHFSQSDKFSYSKYFSQSSKFSGSSEFSKSNDFSNSVKFTKSNPFSYSKYFSQSDKFSESNYFSQSNQFSFTDQFTQSDLFSESNRFTNSDEFSYSSMFTKSDEFSHSEKFTKTGQFSRSNIFSYSNQFSNSDPFSRSIYFSDSSEFSNSHQFSQSSFFTETVGFSSSNYFSKSTQFSNSNLFTKSIQFSASSQFSNSEKFTKSAVFSLTSKFSQSIQFSKSSQFSDSNKFTQTSFFSKSDIFSETQKFSSTSGFSQSIQFSSSKEFTKSSEFSFTNYFSKTGEFSRSIKFTSSDIFSKTCKFSRSKIFSKSNEFKPSHFFSKSFIFSKTNGFTKTFKFSNTEIFSKSRKFSNSDNFISSRPFTHSIQSSQSGRFSDSIQFTLSGEFTESGHFTNSNKFIVNSDENAKSAVKKKKTPMIIGISVGLAALVGIVTVIVVFVVRGQMIAAPNGEGNVDSVFVTSSFTVSREFNPLYDDDINDSRDPYNDPDFDDDDDE